MRRSGWRHSGAGILVAAILSVTPAIPSAHATTWGTRLPWTNDAGKVFDGELWGVSAVASEDAWAVGQVVGKDGVLDVLMLHWDGTAWSRVRPPVVQGTLTAVAARTSTDAWAVGFGDGTVVLHWDGAVWSRVKSPNPGVLAWLWGVSARSSKDAWAVGDYQTNSGAHRALVMHWDGGCGPGPRARTLARNTTLSGP